LPWHCVSFPKLADLHEKYEKYEKYDDPHFTNSGRRASVVSLVWERKV